MYANYDLKLLIIKRNIFLRDGVPYMSIFHILQFIMFLSDKLFDSGLCV